MNLIHKDLSYKIRGGLYEVHNQVGLGRTEETYHKAFCYWMTENDIGFESKPISPLYFKERHVLDLIQDLIVENRLVIELKSRPRKLMDKDSVQLYTYLKRSGIGLGFLVNMGLDRVFIQRHLRERVHYEKITSEESENSQQPTVFAICNILHQIYEEYQTGYSSEIMDRLLFTAFQAENFTVEKFPCIESFYHHKSLGRSNLDCWVINGGTVFCYTCLYENNTFNTSRTKSFMAALSTSHGIAVNFGKHAMEINSFP